MRVNIAIAKMPIAAALIVLVCSCSSGPQIRADGDPAVNLSSYNKTFGFFDTLSTDKSAYGTILSSRLKDATRRELESRGYQFNSTSQQLLVNFHVNLDDRTDVQSTPGAGFYGYRAGLYGPWAGYPQDVETVHYQVGTLAIDLVDATKKQLVWQGVAQGRVHWQQSVKGGNWASSGERGEVQRQLNRDSSARNLGGERYAGRLSTVHSMHAGGLRRR